MQRERRRDPYPWTWEIPTAATLAVALPMVGGIQLARSLANLAAGAGWTWPAPDAGNAAAPIGAAFWTSLPSIMAGRSEAGLPPPTPDHLAGASLLWTVLALTLTVVLAAVARVGVAMYRWGPGRVRGMATTAEAETLLGRSRLRRVAAIIRPDLARPVRSGKVRRPTGPAHTQAPAGAASVPSRWQTVGRNSQAHR